MYRVYVGIMEEKMETTLMGYIGFRFWGLGSRVEGLVSVLELRV